MNTTLSDIQHRFVQVMDAHDRAFLSATDLKELVLIDAIASHARFWADVKADLGVDTLKLVTKHR